MGFSWMENINPLPRYPMKTSNTLVLGLVGLLLGSGLCRAALPPTGSAALTIIQTTTPSVRPAVGSVLPATGQVRMVINIDASGKLADYIMLGYTDQRFAEAAEAAIKKWEFRPAMNAGEPIDVLATLEFNFDQRGQVVSLCGTGLFESYLNTTFGQRPVQCVFYAKDVDVMPKPTRTVSPMAMAGRGQTPTKVIVDFYIDESGHPRMAAVAPNVDAVLAAASIQALEQWRFSPAMRRGVPVAVKASQQFDFAPRVASNN